MIQVYPDTNTRPSQASQSPRSHMRALSLEVKNG